MVESSSEPQRPLPGENDPSSMSEEDVLYLLLKDREGSPILGWPEANEGLILSSRLLRSMPTPGGRRRERQLR